MDCNPEVSTMNSMRILDALTIAVVDHKSLLVAWRMHGGGRMWLCGSSWPSRSPPVNSSGCYLKRN
jgi:hypothetical protein